MWSAFLYICWVVFTRATLCIERVLASATCLSGLSVRYSRYCIKMEWASVIISLPSDSLTKLASGEVWLVEKFARVHLQRGQFVRVWWFRTVDFCDFSTYKPPYLRNGAMYDQGYYWTLIGNRINAFDWYQNQRPWMTLNWPWMLQIFLGVCSGGVVKWECGRFFGDFRPICRNVLKTVLSKHKVTIGRW